ncbi:protein tyrosine phosphatase receptor type C-associated protein [Trichosurus vulpecula]|uniref:protein tyrosine phosphatase receptor type C-associated protein n=1 Tax=Trichosurus vulpecula TaxID=9337 RepID=UPI00186AE8C8|nr:protein tyrosine phosphatase receptor type C-associated protein [Trichosurus vulpecula]
MALSRLMGLVALVALPGALGSEESSSHSSVTVCLLVLLLLILMAGLALAWYHLSQESGGYYHPTRLGTSLWSRARRLLQATGVARWLGGSAVEELQDSMEKQEEEEEEEEEEENKEEDQEEEDQEKDLEPEQEREKQPGQDKNDVPRSSEGPEAAQGEVCLQQGPEPTHSGGRAEALLSDLHAFSGSAAWEDGAGTEGGHGLSVTAL